MNARKRPAEASLHRNSKQRRGALNGHDAYVKKERIYSIPERLLNSVLDYIPMPRTMFNLHENNVQDEVISVSSASSRPVSTPRRTPNSDVKVVLSDSDTSQDDFISRTIVHKSFSYPGKTSFQDFAVGRSGVKPPKNSFSRTPSSSSSLNVLNRGAPRDSARISVQSTPKARRRISTSTSPACSPNQPPSNSSKVTMAFDNVLPEMQNLELKATKRSSRSSQRSGSRSARNSQRHEFRLNNRKHVHERKHKSDVRKRRRDLREEMKIRTYQQSKESDREEFLKKRQLLLDLERASNLPELPIHTKIVKHPPVESSDALTKRSLKRAIANAHKTFNGPKPPKPFHPSYDQLQIARREKDKNIERLLRPPLPETLPQKDDEDVDAILSKSGVIAKFAREQVSDVDIRRLMPGEWLNDELINFYGAMILARSEACRGDSVQVNCKGITTGLLNVYYFSTFFWTKLSKEGYEQGRLAKWTKKVDIFSKDVILIPVNHSNAHWTAAAINFRRKRIESYDSMGMAKESIFNRSRVYLNAEHMNKKKKPFDFTGWENWAPDVTPHQSNGSDCGVFTCHFLEALSRGEEEFAFSQENMAYLRRRMIWEIGHAQLRGGRYE